MEQTLLSEKLRELAEKYSIAGNVTVGFEPGAITVQCDKGNFRFYYDFSRSLPNDELTNVPLLHWRLKRRYLELRNVLLQELVKTTLAMRIHHIVPRDDFTASLRDVLFMETDLIQWISGDTVNKVFAAMDDAYMNGILSTAGGIKASTELGIVPDGSQPVLLHEIIAKTGILSDVVVDTQTQQYPIYVFNGPKTTVYTDIDNELYGLTQTECDATRFILWALRDSVHVMEAQDAARSILEVVEAADKSAKAIVYTPVEGGRLA